MLSIYSIFSKSECSLSTLNFFLVTGEVFDLRNVASNSFRFDGRVTTRSDLVLDAAAVASRSRRSNTIASSMTGNCTITGCGSGCGSVGRAVASHTRGPRIESSHRQTLFY